MSEANEAIRRLQEDLRMMGFDPGPIDGVIGPKTRAAISRYTGGLTVTVDETLRKKIAGEAATNSAALHQHTPPAPPSGYLDLSDRCTNLAWRRCAKCRKPAGQCKHAGGPLLRSWKEIDHLNIHQWGAPAVDAPERHLGLKAHYSITRGGQIYRIHPELCFGWDAQGLSPEGIGLEFVGVLLGVKGDMKTRPGAPAGWGTHTPTELQIDAGKRLIRYLCGLAAYHGGKITGIYPHRVAAPRDSPKQRRRPDPGEELWKGVALPLMLELGLTDGGPGFTIGKGEPIPEAWDSSRVGIKY